MAATVAEPAGFAVLVQEIAAADYRDRTVTFCGQLRDHGGSSLTARGSSDWTWHQVTVPVPREATAILFGISLTGHGRIELRGAELTPAPPGTRE